MSSASALDREPNYSYSPQTAATGKFNSPGEALSAMQAYYAQQSVLYPPPYLQQRALSVMPNPNSYSINGHPTGYLVAMQSADYGGPWQPVYYANYIALNVECSAAAPDMVTVPWDGPFSPPPGGVDVRTYCTKYGAPPAVPPQPSFCPGNCAGNPIFPATGLKLQRETDYTGSGANQLRFERIYRSDRGGWSHNYQRVGLNFNGVSTPQRAALACALDVAGTTGRTFCSNFSPSGSAESFIVGRGDGQFTIFGSDSGTSPDKTIKDRLTRVLDANNQLLGWSLYIADDETTEFYDTRVRLMSITDRVGRVTSMSYSDATTPVDIAPQADMLIGVADQYGHTLKFTYDIAGRLNGMTDPAGGKFVYRYEEASSVVRPGGVVEPNLTSVTYPDGKIRTYWYNEPDKTANANVPRGLTGIVDENGVRFAIFKFDASGKAISTEHAGGVERFVATPAVGGSSTLTSPLGQVTTMEFSSVAGRLENTRRVRAASAGIPAAETQLRYDANGNLASRTDWRGVLTSYTYDLSRNLETRRIEADGTPLARTFTTVWHASRRLPVTEAGPKLITTYDYDGNGNVLVKTEQATSDETGAQGLSAVRVGAVRRWTRTYTPTGMLKTATGPRTDVVDTTRYDYDSNGNLQFVTNAAGHVTKFENYDEHGHARRIVAPNNAVTNIEYSPRGWVDSVTVTGQGAPLVTEYTYDNIGQVIKTTFPDGSVINNVYDDAHRLIEVSDGLGNAIHYELDVMGNRIKEQVKDASGTLTRQTARQFDILNRLKEQTGGTP